MIRFKIIDIISNVAKYSSIQLNAVIMTFLSSDRFLHLELHRECELLMIFITLSHLNTLHDSVYKS